MNALVLTTVLIALPPPLCRGKSYARFDPAQNRSPTERAIQEIRKAYEALCPLVAKDGVCGSGEIFQNPTIGNNAVTWITSGLGQGRHTRARIVYSPQFLNGLDKAFGPGASFGVLAHEVGHHLTASGNMRKKFEHAWDEELRADFFAGCALARTGSPPDGLENALRALASVATPTHPSFASRTRKVRAGYDQCNKLQAAKDRVTARGKKPFGIGAYLRRKSGKGGCWGYFFRLQEDIEQVGPVAAPRNLAGGFGSRASCEKSRKRFGDASEPCACR